MKIINSNITIKNYESKFDIDFFDLNKAWLEESWILEESDKKDLLNPKKIINNGGQIFFAVYNQITIGTVAMIKSSNNIFVDFANQNNAKEIFLISNDSLKIARNLYDKYGFIEVVLDSPKYDRGNVKMVLKITN